MTQAPRPKAARPIARRRPGRTERFGAGRERRRATRLRLTPLRAGALLVMLLALLGAAGLAASPAFAYRTLEIDGADALLTDRAAIESAVAAVAGPRAAAAGSGNVFLVEAGRIEAALRELPTVADADVSIGLPGTLRVALRERNAVLGWVVGRDRFVVDETGLVIARFPADEPGPSRPLVTVLDRRVAASSLAVGVTLDPVVVDAATRIGSLTTGDIGSAKSGYRLALDDTDGFTLQPLPDGPVAVFGFYTASLRSPEMIPGQVRLLRSLLVGREAKLGWIVLASETNGTYLPKGSRPAPLRSPSPSPAPVGPTPSPVPSASAAP